jgi:hypothetical protein
LEGQTFLVLFDPGWCTSFCRGQNFVLKDKQVCPFLSRLELENSSKDKKGQIFPLTVFLARQSFCLGTKSPFYEGQKPIVLELQF